MHRTALVAMAALSCVILPTWTAAARAVEPAPQAAAEHHAPASAVTPQQALDRLKEGNARFVAGKPLHPHQNTERRAGLLTTQHPFAVILGCGDSRVPIETIFDQGFGDLFVVRVIGNIASEDEKGSIEYAVGHLGVPLALVLGHEGCGAVTAAFMTEEERKREPSEVQSMLAQILPALKDAGTGEDRVLRGVESNTRMSTGQLLQTPTLKAKVASHELQIKAAVYELGTGKVRILD